MRETDKRKINGERIEMPHEVYLAGVEDLKSFFNLNDAEFLTFANYIHRDGIERAISDPQAAVDDPGPWGLVVRLGGYMQGGAEHDPELAALFTKIKAKKTPEPAKSAKEVQREQIMAMSDEILKKERELRALVAKRNALEAQLGVK